MQITREQAIVILDALEFWIDEEGGYSGPSFLLACEILDAFPEIHHRLSGKRQEVPGYINGQENTEGLNYIQIARGRSREIHPG